MADYLYFIEVDYVPFKKRTWDKIQIFVYVMVIQIIFVPILGKE